MLSINAIDQTFRDVLGLSSNVTNPYFDRWCFLDGVISLELESNIREQISSDGAMYYIDTTNNLIRVCHGIGYVENGYSKFLSMDGIRYDPETITNLNSLTAAQNLALLPTHDYLDLEKIYLIELPKLTKYDPYKFGQTR